MKWVLEVLCLLCTWILILLVKVSYGFSCNLFLLSFCCVIFFKLYIYIYIYIYKVVQKLNVRLLMKLVLGFKRYLCTFISYFFCFFIFCSSIMTRGDGSEN